MTRVDDGRRASVDRILGETIDLLTQVRGGDLEPLSRAVDAIAEAFGSGQALLAFGNGGSAADASTSSPSWWAGISASGGRRPPWP